LAAAVEDLDLMTNVAIAFPRNPIHLAHQANDLQLLTKGRFTLGLGTQVRTQIEKRFGAEFDRPVARMTELVRALRAIFAAWNSGDRLDFRGRYYRHTLMTPTFSPGRQPVRAATDLRRRARAAVDQGHRQGPPTACSSCRSARSGSCTRRRCRRFARGWRPLDATRASSP
jgi:alkanesulfonate monooxygenase SsuD/methylene tetrahydromethanopterin reductase-like flavin-dependent oxidoreductase (luciferase family)